MTTAANTQASSKKPTKKNPSWVSAISMVIFFFLAAGAGLYYTYVVNLQEYFTDRNFRLLTLHQSLLKTKLSDYRKIFESSVPKNPDITLKPPSPGTLTCDSKIKDHLLIKLKSFLCKKNNDFHESKIVIPLEQAEKKGYWVLVDRLSGGYLNLVYHDEIPFEPVNIPFEVSTKIKLADLVEQFKLSLENLVFDDLIVAAQDGYVLYQENQSLFQFSRIDRLLQASQSDNDASKDT